MDKDKIFAAAVVSLGGSYTLLSVRVIYNFIRLLPPYHAHWNSEADQFSNNVHRCRVRTSSIAYQGSSELPHEARPSTNLIFFDIAPYLRTVGGG